MTQIYLRNPRMPYLIDRQRALRTADIVAIVTGARRGERSRATLRDNSLHRTASRVKMLVEAAERGLDMEDGRRKGVAWWTKA